jgi:phosphoribosyl-ATP pyrophosphohydrolase/phosphoribosyl-AMP cyclohydrolase/histidinol dehydrogenase
MRCWERLGRNVEATSWSELVLFICAVSHFKSKLNARGGWIVGAKVKLCIKKCGLDVRRPFGTGNCSSDPCQFFTPDAPPKTPPPSDRRQNEEFLDSIHVSSNNIFAMDTTLPLPFLPSVDLGKGATESENGLTRKQLSYLGCVHFAATSQNVDTLLQFLQRHVSIEAYIDVTEVQSTEDIIIILDAGARKVFVKPSQLDALSQFEERVVPVVEAQGTSSTAKYPNGVYLTSGSAKESLGNLKDAKVSPIFLATSAEDIESTVKLATEHSAVPIIPATSLVVGTPSKGQFSVDVLIGESWTSDRSDRLVPTVVTDERGIALGLVYSSRESLAESIKTGTGVYQSRKRGLWYKGATSGDTQELVRISLDCDQDCLKFVVRQKGRGM